MMIEFSIQQFAPCTEWMKSERQSGHTRRERVGLRVLADHR